MTNTVPLFERSTSALYHSNDGLLHVVDMTEEDDAYRTFNVMRVPDRDAAAEDGEVMITTRERALADAYIAGYDLAMGDEVQPPDQLAAGTTVRVVNPITNGHVARAIVADEQDRPQYGVAVWLTPSVRPGKDRDLAHYPVSWLIKVNPDTHCVECGAAIDNEYWACPECVSRKPKVVAHPKDARTDFVEPSFGDTERFEDGPHPILDA